MADRRTGKKLKGLVVIYITAAKHSAVPMGGVFTHTDVGNQKKLWAYLLGSMERPLNDPLRIICLRTNLILMLRDPKEHDLTDPGFFQAKKLFLYPVYGESILARERRNLFHFILSVHNKHGKYQ